jgi:protein TonB
VSFVVRSDGDVSSVRLVRSSGSPDLDKTAVAIIRRAAPFPPIPPEADRATWAFTLPIGPF